MRIDIATPLGVGLGLGLSAGLVTGMMAGLPGLLVGLAAGTLTGMALARAMRRDDERRAARTRELDGIIGVTQGDLGAAPVRMPESIPAAAESAARMAWAAEWLTPPPPVAS
jgi:hypothetical protein